MPVTINDTVDLLPVTTMRENDGFRELTPFVVMFNGHSHVPCWLEWHDGKDFDPEAARNSEPPSKNKFNVLTAYRSLPSMIVTVNGCKTSTYLAVCDRSLGGPVGVLQCDDGTLWTVLPEKQ